MPATKETLINGNPMHHHLSRKDLVAGAARFREVPMFDSLAISPPLMQALIKFWYFLFDFSGFYSLYRDHLLYRD
jgi:hypothetical protein